MEQIATGRVTQHDHQVTIDGGQGTLSSAGELRTQLATSLVAQSHMSGQSLSPQQRNINSHTDRSVRNTGTEHSQDSREDP